MHTLGLLVDSRADAMSAWAFTRPPRSALVCSHSYLLTYNLARPGPTISHQGSTPFSIAIKYYQHNHATSEACNNEAE